jgi:hypothetical protein
MEHSKTRISGGRDMIHPLLHLLGGCHSTYAAAMLCSSGLRDVPDEAEKPMALQYRMRLKGTLDDSWSDWFDGMTISHDAGGDTMLEGAVRDQTALYGLIAKARDLGLTLIAVEQRTSATKTDSAAMPGSTSTTDLSQ